MAIQNIGIKKYLHKDLQKSVNIIHKRIGYRMRLLIDFGGKNQSNTEKGSVTKVRFGLNNVNGRGMVGFNNDDLFKSVVETSKLSTFPKNVVVLDKSTLVLKTEQPEEVKND